MGFWELPTSIDVGGEFLNIRTDYRAILDILKYFEDPDYEKDERMMICLQILYIDFDRIPQERYPEAAEKAMAFIDGGIKGDGRPKPRTMDWEQDAPIIIPAINRVVGKEIRAVEYMHWYTFLGAYMEIGQSVFSTVVEIRKKKALGRKLEKWEKEYLRDNRELVELKTKYTQEELDEQERLLRELG